MTDLLRRFVSAGAAAVLAAIVTSSVSTHVRAADLNVIAGETLQTITGATSVAEGITPSIAHHWPG